MGKSLYTYIVRYDSGFAPNPFFGYCTLATCKPDIRSTAAIGDWVIGTGSAAKDVNRGGHLVFAMQVTEILNTSDYWNDARFLKKRPNLFSGWMNAAGDNIYEPREDGSWKQHNSHHTQADGSQNPDHVHRDTRVQRVLVSNKFVYFGAQGDKLPKKFLPEGSHPVVMKGIGYRKKTDMDIIKEFETWFDSLPDSGFQGEPWDWIHRPSKRGYF